MVVHGRVLMYNYAELYSKNLSIDEQKVLIKQLVDTNLKMKM
jgi:hypothetical protein